MYCRYSLYLEEDIKTDVISGTRNPEFNFERRFTFECTSKVEKNFIPEISGKELNFFCSEEFASQSMISSFLLLHAQVITFLKEKSVIVQLWGKQIVDKKPVNAAAKKGKDTKAIMRAETMKKQNVSATDWHASQFSVLGVFIVVCNLFFSYIIFFSSFFDP